MDGIIILLSDKWQDYVSLASLIISFIALWVTWKTFWLKIWDKYRTITYSPISSIETTDTYISSITIQNLKDKPLVVFKIHFQLGYNIFIELEDFEKKPLIIKPFEVYQWNYWPILFYSDSWFKKYNLNKLFEDRKIKNKVILETIEWDYKKFHVLHKFFNNYYTWILQPFRFFHNKQSFGDKIDYIIDFIYENWKVESLWIQQNDFKILKNIELNKEILSSKIKLEKFLNKNRKKLVVPCKKIEVIDLKEEINNRFNYDNLQVININERVVFFQYHILWKIYTLIEKIKTNIINSKIYRKYKSKQ